MPEELERPGHIVKSISYSQDQILRDIMELHTGRLEADVTYGQGAFYRKFPPLLVDGPRWKSDLDPRRPGVMSADFCHLPFKSNSLKSVVFDPPFMARTGPGAMLKERFGELIGTIQDLWWFYFRGMAEIYRALKPGGWLVFKCQDGVLSGVNNFTHCEIYRMAKDLGFRPVDLFVLLAKYRMMHPKHQRQVHARKYHAYFWVFQK